MVETAVREASWLTWHSNIIQNILTQKSEKYFYKSVRLKALGWSGDRVKWGGKAGDVGMVLLMHIEVETHLL